MTPSADPRTPWSSEALRRAALDALGPAADQRALEALRGCSISIAPSVARWNASMGTMEAHRVTLAVDARTLGTLRSAPAVVDALCAAVAAAIATRPGEALLELSLRWAAASHGAPGPYRDAPPAAATLADALVQYLEAMGEAEVAHLVSGASVEASGAPEAPELVVGVDRETWESRGAGRERLREPRDRRAHAALSLAAQDLLGSAAARVRYARLHA